MAMRVPRYKIDMWQGLFSLFFIIIFEERGVA